MVSLNTEIATNTEETFEASFTSSSQEVSTEFGTYYSVGGNGANGLSAYEIAVKNGFSGSETEWLLSLQGTAGIDGKDGVDGKDGIDGYTPVKGIDYTDGTDGKDGIDGEDGVSVTHQWSGTTLVITSASGTSSVDLRGEKGDAGEKGDKGDQGEKGDTGASGSNGKDGINGADGISATHKWSGTVLTITSASGSSSMDLKGEKGDKGDQGEKGDTGPQGSQGPQGIAGTDGKDGVDGTNGKDGEDGYTPQKGVDYFTEADKEEMIASVIASLPVYDGTVVSE